MALQKVATVFSQPLLRRLAEIVNTLIDRANAPGVRLLVPFFLAGDTTSSTFLDLTDQSSSEQFLNNSSDYIIPADLRGYAEYRLFGRVLSASSSANSPRLYAKYSASFSTSTDDYDHLSGAELALPLDELGGVTDWAPLSPDAQADVWLTIMQAGGDGAADPRLSQVMLQFR